MTVRAEGSEDSVANRLASAVRHLVAELEDDPMRVVSRGAAWAPTADTKSVAVAGSAAVRRLMRTSMRALGFHVQPRAKNLGVDYAPRARVRKREVQQTRRRQQQARRARIRRLPAAAAVRVNRTGTRPARMYGAAVAGIADAYMSQIRAEAAEMHGESRGRSTTMRLAARRDDPALQYYMRVIGMWAAMIWSRRMPDDIMQDAWKHAMVTVGLAEQPHTATTGGAGVMVTVLRDLGWAFPAFHAVRTADGVIVDMRRTCMKTIMHYAKDDYEVTAARKSVLADRCGDYSGALGFPLVRTPQPHSGEEEPTTTDAAGGGDEDQGGDLSDEERRRRSASRYEATLWGVRREEREQIEKQWRDRGYLSHGERPIPWYEPVARVAAMKAAKHSPALASVIALAEGGWWSPWRRYIDGLCQRPICACGQVACLHHMLVECPRSATMRSEHHDQAVFQEARTQRWNRLFSIGAPMRPAMPSDPRDLREDFGDADHPRHLKGEVFTDGAMRGRCRRVLRAGWSFAMVDCAGAVVWGRFGTIAERYPSVLRSELRALLEAVRCSAGKLTVHVDNAQVVRGFQMGRKWCVSPRREAADLWRDFWDAAEPLGANLCVVKVKAHLPDTAIADGVITRMELLGNRAADALAKRGALLAVRDSPSAAVERAFSQALRWYEWAMHYAANWPDEAQPPAAAATSSTPAAAHEGGPRRPAARTRAAARTGGAEAATEGRTTTRAPWKLHASSPHILWTAPNAVVCRRCGRASAAKADKHRRAFARSPCGGSAAGRAAARLGFDLRARETRCRIGREDLRGRGYTPLNEALPDESSDDDLPQSAVAPPPAMPSDVPLCDDAAADREQRLEMGTVDTRATAEQSEDAPARKKRRLSGGSQSDAEADTRPPTSPTARRAGDDIDQHQRRPHHDHHLHPHPRGEAPPGEHASGATVAQERGQRRDRPADDQPLEGDVKRRRHGLEVTDDRTDGAELEPRGAEAAAVNEGGTSVTWLPSTRWGVGHQMKLIGPIAYCAICGRYAIERVGRGLLDVCHGPDEDTRSRVQRMKDGRHPITGISLTDH